MRIHAVIFTVFSIALFLSCDNSDNWTEKRAQELSKVFRDETLTMTFNNQETYHKAVAFNTVDLNSATLEIRYLIPGESPLNIKDVILKENKDQNTYSFTTSVSNDDREIDITGNIGDRLVMDVQYKVISPLAGSWAPAGNLFQSPLKLEIIPGSGSQTINMHGVMGANEIPIVGGFDRLIGQMGGTIFSIAIQLSLDLKENSELIAYWKLVTGTPSQSGEGMVQYNVVNDRAFVAVAVEKLLGNSLETLSIPTSHLETLIALLQKVYQGLPIPISFTENDNKVQVRITRAMMVPYLDALIEVLAPSLGEVDLGTIGGLLGLTKENLPLFMGELVRVIKESEAFEIQFDLKRTA